ncbi:MAG: hypothetical protein FH748_08595 [Balneolaceae bacterium]|nr:hypothetical protein [Balneolaceae bacterium]
MNYFSKHIPFASVLAVICALLFTTEVLAQTGGFTGASLRMGYNARSLAMANAMTASTSEGTFVYYNPAHAALFSETNQADMTVGALSYDRIFQSAGASFQMPPSAGIAFSLLRTGVQDIDGRSQSGYHTGYFDASEYQLLTNFGIRFSSRLNGGIGIKFSIADYHQQLDNPVAVGIDLGFLFKASDQLNIGLAVQDLFASYSWNSKELYSLDQSQNVVNKFPARLKAGAAYHNQQFTLSGELELLVTESELSEADVFVSRGRPTVLVDEETITNATAILRLGGSWYAHERFTLRGGWRLPDASNSDSWALSSGFSIHLPFDVFSPSIDYAFVMEPYRISNMHVFSLRLNI